MRCRRKTATGEGCHRRHAHHVISHDAECEICRHRIDANARDHDRNLCSWCISIARGPEKSRLTSEDIEDAKRAFDGSGHGFRVVKVVKAEEDEPGPKWPRNVRSPKCVGHVPSMTSDAMPTASWVSGETEQAWRGRTACDPQRDGMAAKPLLSWQDIPDCP